MANYVYNLLKCNNELTYETIKSHITNNGQSFDGDSILPMSDDPKQLFKEILEGGLLDCDKDTIKYYLEEYTIKALWKKLYWGCNGLYRFTCDDDKKEIQFYTSWTAPFGIIDALRKLSLNFEWFYIYESENHCFTAKFTQTECTEVEVPRTDQRVVDFCNEKFWPADS